jgi:ABC-type multidrug transport system fused ATPase/permease subunit
MKPRRFDVPQGRKFLRFAPTSAKTKSMKLRCERPSNLDLISDIEMDVRTLRVDEKAKEVLKTVGLFWGLSLVSVLIPVFHFVLVPLFLFLSVVFGFRARKKNERLLHETAVTCLACGSQNKLKPTTFEWPLTFRCQKCAEPHRLRPL